PVRRRTVRREHRHRHSPLGARLATGLAGVAATGGAAFGAIGRPAVNVDDQHPPSPSRSPSPHETPVRTAPAQRFVAAAQGGRGLAVLAPAFFEYEWTARGDLLVPLLRAIGDLFRGDLPVLPGHA